MFSFKGITADSKGLIVMNVTESILPPVESKLIKVTNRHGAYQSGFQFDTKEIQVDYFVKGTSLTDIRQKMRAIGEWLFSTNEEELFFNDETNKKYKARVVGNTEIEQTHYHSQGTITFECSSPFATGSLKSQSITSGTAFTVTGNFKTKPKLTFTFSATSTEIKFTLGADYIRLIDNFAIGDVVIVDCETGKVTVNNQVRMNILDLNSHFYDLNVGSNTISIAPLSKGTLNLQYTEKFL